MSSVDGEIDTEVQIAQVQPPMSGNQDISKLLEAPPLPLARKT